MPRKSIQEVLKSHIDRLMSVPVVVGVAEGESRGKPCIMVFVTDKNPEFLKDIPGMIDGYRLLVVESGNFMLVAQETRALATMRLTLARMRSNSGV